MASYFLLVNCVEGNVRLTNDNVDVHDFIKDEVARGRVDICINNAFVTVCDMLWNNMDASVVCQQLGFSPHGTNLFVFCMYTTLVHS